MGEKCERCGRANVGHAAPVGEHCYVAYEAAGSSGVNESTRGECEKIARVRAPLDAQIATLTRERDAAIAEAAGLRARLEDAEARWRSAERQCNNRHCEVPGCPPSRTVITGNISVTKGVRAERSPADRERRCVEHTTNERAVVKT